MPEPRQRGDLVSQAFGVAPVGGVIEHHHYGRTHAFWCSFRRIENSRDP